MEQVSDWLPIVFHFGTENWEEQLKKHPVYRIKWEGVFKGFISEEPKSHHTI